MSPASPSLSSCKCQDLHELILSNVREVLQHFLAPPFRPTIHTSDNIGSPIVIVCAAVAKGAMHQVAFGKSAAAPSANLLKFLRAQVHGQPFFSANHAPRQARCQARGALAAPRRPRSNSRSMVTIAPSCLEASMLPPISSLFPRRKDQFPAHDRWAYEPSLLPRAGTTSSYHVRQPRSTRSASTKIADDESADRLGGWWSRIFGSGRTARSKSGLQPNDLPPLSGFLDDSGTLGRVVPRLNELRLRCTEFDEHGNVTLMNSEFKKSELIAKYGLPPRDLRKIDSSLLPSILIRPQAILINLLHLRVLIKHNRVLVFDAYGSTDSYTQSLFMYDLEGKLRSPETAPSHLPNPSSLPYEFRALEAVLISVTSSLEGEFETVREPVVKVLRELEEDIDRDKLRHLLIYSKKLGTFEQKARLVRDAIDDLLEADDDLASMYLSEKAKGIEREEDDHTEVEMLLESYHKVTDEIVQVSGNLVSNIRNTEEIVKAILDANRNSLMLLDLKFSIGTLGIGGGTFVAALYGMNLKNFIEESDLGFWGVSAWCFAFSVFVCMYGLRKLRRVQRVSMWGAQEGDKTRGRSGWAKLGGGVERAEALMGFGRQARLKGMQTASATAQGVAGAGTGAANGHGQPATPVSPVLPPAKLSTVRPSKRP